MDPIVITIVCDGGSRRNGSGDSEGYYSFAVIHNGNVVKIVRGVCEIPGATNNQMEYDALLNSLRYSIDLAARAGRPVKLTVKTDSSLVVNQVNGKWKVKNEDLDIAREAVEYYASQLSGFAIEWQPRERTVAILGH